MNQPIIVINLRKHLHDFLLHEFEASDDGAIILNRRSDIGLYIDSMWSISDLPVKPSLKENPVRLRLPISEENHYVKRYHFLYVPTWRELQIQDYLEAEFRRRVRDFFTVGYEKKFKQKDIIEAFLTEYGIKNNAVNFDQIKKLDYRNRRNFKKDIVKEIQQAISQ
jgi:hypothetical protein